MPITNLVLPDGTKITIEGSAQEVASIINKISQSTKPKAETKHIADSRTTRKTKTIPKGPTGHILSLNNEGYFKARRTLSDIQKKLEEKGYIYARTSLSPVLVRLTRKREIRRIKTSKGWVYVA
jgi:hypothetical protein